LVVTVETGIRNAERHSSPTHRRLNAKVESPPVLTSGSTVIPTKPEDLGQLGLEGPGCRSIFKALTRSGLRASVMGRDGRRTSFDRRRRQPELRVRASVLSLPAFSKGLVL